MENRLPQKISVFLQTRWATLLNLGLVALLCWQLAHWTWVFLAPAPTRPTAASFSAPDLEHLLDTIRAAHLFGGTTGQAVPRATETQATTALNLKLSGVFATTGPLPAVAIIKVESQGELPFRTGDMILPGVALEQVLPDHIVLNRGGVMEKLLLERKSKPLALQGMTAQLNVRREGRNRFGVSRIELNQVFSSPELLASAGRARELPGQGVRIEEARPGSLISQLGLEEGDIIRRINDKPVFRTADILGAYQTSNSISVEGVRKGRPFQYNYSVR